MSQQSMNMMTEEIERLESLNDELVACCKATLLFYSLDWNAEKKALWAKLTGDREATTRVLCDLQRETLAKVEAQS